MVSPFMEKPPFITSKTSIHRGSRHRLRAVDLRGGPCSATFRTPTTPRQASAHVFVDRRENISMIMWLVVFPEVKESHFWQCQSLYIYVCMYMIIPLGHST